MPKRQIEQLTDSDVMEDIEQSQIPLKKPPLYKVFLLNDDFTPMDFVVQVLQSFFSMEKEKATRVMLTVHQHGKGECGIYTRDVAETKVAQVNEYSRQQGHPLLCEMEAISESH